MQRSRFDENGAGLGLEGSRDDTTMAELFSGKAVILRGTSSISPTKIMDPHSDYVPPSFDSLHNFTTFISPITANDFHDFPVTRFLQVQQGEPAGAEALQRPAGVASVAARAPRRVGLRPRSAHLQAVQLVGVLGVVAF